LILTTCGNEIEWRHDPDPAEWDSALARLEGHPLQSAFWGDARRAVDGIRDHRWWATCRGVPVWMVRFEERRIPGLGCIAWAPKGPTGALPGGAEHLPRTLVERLKELGVILVITDPWKDDSRDQATALSVRPRTIWIDMGPGRDGLWQNLDKQWRYGVGRAERLGVTVDTSRLAGDVEAFFALCTNISQTKGFRLPASIDLMKRLLEAEQSDSVEAQLFIARHDGRLGAGAFVMRCGRSIHYFWGATDRALSKQRVGEAVQWAAMEWALTKKCCRYDLEGIDPQRNPGVYEFKKKMGGREVTLAGKQRFPLGVRGELVSWLDAHLHA
jgi:Acetyltransferase (GNAT) domain